MDQLTQKEIEYLLLLLLKTSKRGSLSHLHIQKEMFLLRDATKYLQEMYHYFKHYRGPYSKDIAEALFSPMYLDNSWGYKESRDKKLSGGYFEITAEGRKEAEKILEKMRSQNNQKLIQIVAAMKLLHDLYDDLSPKELLYVVYKTPKYKEFTKKSIVFNEVISSDAKYSLKKKYLDNAMNSIQVG